MGDDYLSDGEEGNQSAGDDDDLAEDTEGMMTHKLTYDSGVAVSLTTQSGKYFFCCLLFCHITMCLHMYTHMHRHTHIDTSVLTHLHTHL